MDYGQFETSQRHVHCKAIRPRLIAFLGSCAVVALAAPSAARAQAEAQSAPGVEEIIVTARKTSENLQRTPVAVTALTSRYLEEHAVKDVTDISQTTPNLVLQVSGANGASKTPAIYLRGLGQADTVLTADPAVGLYLDGIYIARNTGAITDLVDLDRIEVLRGPQGTLFGKNTIGGAINLISKKPSDKFDAGLDLTYGKFDRTAVRGMINAPLSDTLAVRLTAYGNRQDGYVKLSNYPGREFGDDRTWGVRGQLRWAPADTVTFNLSADYSSSHNTGAPGVLLNTYPGAITAVFYNLLSGDPTCMTPAGQATNPACFGPVHVQQDPRVSPAAFFDVNGQRSEPHNIFTAFGVNLEASVELPFGTMKSISSYRGLRSNYDADGGLVGGLFFESLADRQDSDQYSQEIQLSGKALDDRLKWLIGGYYFYEYNFSHVYVLSALAAAPFLGTTYPLLTDNDQPTHTHNAAAFAQATYDLTRRLHLTGGLRWTWEKKDAKIFLRPAMPSGLSGNLTVRRATPLVTLAADVSPNVYAYATYSEGFRSGGFPPRIIGQVSSIPAYGPETAKSFEVGLKSTLFAQKLRANFAFFTTGYNDFQGPGTRLDLNPPFGTIINAGDARIKGAELEISAVPSKFLQLDGSVSHLLSKLTRADPTLNDDGVKVPVGKRLPFSPKWKASAGATLSVPLNRDARITARAEISYTSRMYFSLLNIDEVSQRSVTLVNGGIAYHSPGDHWQISLDAKNLTDRSWYTAKGRSLGTTGTLTGVLAPPRTWALTAHWRY